MERSGLHHLAATVIAIGAAAAYAWWTTALRPFTWPALFAVAAAGVIAIVVGTRGRPAPQAAGPASSGAWIWGVLCLLLAGWELAAWLQQPRADHPTLSSLANQVLGSHPVRAMAFLVWLALGAGLARR